MRAGYTQPTKIQCQAVPAALEGRDLLATANTGTGKTAAFTLPMIQRLGEDAVHGRPRGLVVTPTRELAQQVAAAIETYAVTSNVECVVVHGGTHVGSEARELGYGCDVLVATPGRLLDHLRRGAADLSEVEVLVLDEADRMLDMGFIDDVKAIVRATPRTRQTLLFSATMPGGVLWLAHEMMEDPVRVAVGLETAAEGIRQVVHPVDWPAKHQLLLHLLEERTAGQVLIFTRRRDTTSYLAEYFDSSGVSVDDLHGGKPQRLRDRSLERFRAGETRVGDDTGEAVTLMSPNDWHHVRDIETLMGATIEREIVAGYEPTTTPPAPGPAAKNGAGSDDRPRSALSRGVRRRKGR